MSVTQFSDYRWLSNESRYAVRPWAGAKMTGLQDKDVRTLPRDLRAVETAVAAVAAQSCLPWDPWYAHVEVPKMDEAWATVDPAEVVWRNRSSLAVCDAGIFHLYDDATGSLGMWIRELADCSRRVPVLLVAHEGERVSINLEKLSITNSNVAFKRFRDEEDLGLKATEWLASQLDVVEDGPNQRRRADEEHSFLAELMQTAWRAAQRGRGSTDVPTILGRIPFTMEYLDFLFEIPTALSELSWSTLTQLLAALDVDVQQGHLAKIVNKLFAPDEVRAWKVWRDSVNTQFAWQVLAAAVAARQTSDTVYRQGFFGQRGAWEEFAEGWTRRENR